MGPPRKSRRPDPIEDIAAALWQQMIRFDEVCRDPSAVAAMQRYERHALGGTVEDWGWWPVNKRLEGRKRAKKRKQLGAGRAARAALLLTQEK